MRRVAHPRQCAAGTRARSACGTDHGRGAPIGASPGLFQCVAAVALKEQLSGEREAALVKAVLEAVAELQNVAF